MDVSGSQEWLDKKGRREEDKKGGKLGFHKEF